MRTLASHGLLHWSALLRLPARAALLTILALASQLVLATHVQIDIISSGSGAAPFADATPSIFDLNVVTSAGRASVSGGLLAGLTVPTGKRAVGLLGFKDDLVLLEAMEAKEIEINPGEAPVLVQLFKLDFYANPLAQGLDPTELLRGYSTTFMVKSRANTCPFDEPVCLAGDGAFDLTNELGNPDDTLRVYVRVDPSELVPEPGSMLLFEIGSLALGATHRSRTRRA